MSFNNKADITRLAINNPEMFVSVIRDSDFNEHITQLVGRCIKLP